MSEKMIAVARAFGKGKGGTFPIMTAKELEKFLEVMRTERLKQTH